MISILRIFDGRTISDHNAASFSSFSIGADRSDDYTCKGSDPDRKRVVFSNDRGMWTVRIDGMDSRVTKPISFEKPVVISKRFRQAAMLLRIGASAHVEARITDREFTIGRGPDNTIVLDDESVSRKHARILTCDNVSRIYDENSTGGTYVNGVSVKEAVLAPGDIIVIGAQYLAYDGKSISSCVPDYLACETEGTRPTHDIAPRLTPEIEVGKNIKIEVPPPIGTKRGFNPLSLMSLLYSPVYGAVNAAVQGGTAISGKLNLKKYMKLREEVYGNYLDGIEKDRNDYIARKTKALRYIDPDLNECFDIALKRDRRLWERQITDDDFMCVRIGKGTVAADYVLESPKQALTLTTDPLIENADRIAREKCEVLNAPITCALSCGCSVGIVGNQRDADKLLSNMIVEAATLHSYNELKIVAFLSKETRDDWMWMRWLPHTFSDNRQVRYISDNRKDSEALSALLENILEKRTNQTYDNSFRGVIAPFYLFVISDFALVSKLGIVKYLTQKLNDVQAGVLYLTTGFRLLPKECDTIIEVNSSSGVIYEKQLATVRQAFTFDALEKEKLDRFSRALAPIALDKGAEEAPIPQTIAFLDGYGVKRVDQINLQSNWLHAQTVRSLAVPIGMGANNKLFEFDIHEKHHGVNGMVAGMPGSGKTEMAQSWLLSLSLKFSPEDVSFILIDFKGTSLIAPFRNSPHMAGSISDIDTNISRNLIALKSEIDRREKLLAEYAGVISKTEINSYNDAYYRGIVPEKLPILIVVIDEYAQFRKAFPDFGATIDKLTSTGRALGIFIVLMTQTPAGVVSGQSEGNINFRWCLKVANPDASRDMIKRNDAAYITNPGRAFIKVGEDEVFEEVQSLWSGAPYRPYAKDPSKKAAPVAVVDLSGRRHVYADESTATGFKSSKTQIEAVVEYIDSYVSEHGLPRARKLWDAALPERITLKDVIKTGFDGTHWSESDGQLSPVIGLSDDPHNQSQYPLQLDLSRDGSCVVCGAPGTGKTTLLHTLVMSLAISYSPDEIYIYAMDFGSWSLNRFEGLPHVGGVANSGEDEKITKLVAMLGNMLTERKQLFAKALASSIAAYRVRSSDKLPYIVLLVDNIASVLAQHPGLDSFFLSYAQEGGNYGMYLVATAGSFNTVSYKLKAYIKCFLALQQTDASDYSAIVGKTGGLIPQATPGRGLAKKVNVMEFQTALPGGGVTDDEISASIVELSRQMSAVWIGERPAMIPVMPENIPFGSVSAEGIAIGLSTDDLRPVDIDFSENHYLLISGTSRSGKSNLLQVISRQLIQKETTLVIFDTTDSLDKLTPTADSFLRDAQAIDSYLSSLVGELQRRKDAYSAGKDERFSKIAIVIDDLKACFDSISDQSVRRLEMIVRLGKGLGVFLVVAGNNVDISRFYSQGEALTTALAGGDNCVLLGGSFRVHTIFNADLSYSEKESALGYKEGYVLEKGKATRFKAMNEE